MEYINYSKEELMIIMKGLIDEVNQIETYLWENCSIEELEELEDKHDLEFTGPGCVYCGS